jgi:four helix bundle protein
VQRSTRGFEDLEVYRRGMALLKPVHALVLRFPDYEKFDLASQMRRACKSIPANIAEGYARRRTPKEFCSYLAIAVGSANEMEVHFRIALELEYVTEGEYEEFNREYQTIGKQLSQLIKYWRSVGAPETSTQSQGDQ